MATFQYYDHRGRVVVEKAHRMMVHDGCLLFVNDTGRLGDHEFVKCVNSGEWSRVRKVDDRSEPRSIDTGMRFRGQKVFIQSSGYDGVDRRNVDQFTRNVEDYIDDRRSGV